MTWGKSFLLLSISVIFDFLRAFFALLFITGPALVGVVSGAVASQYLGSWLGGAVGAAAGAVSFLGAPELEAFGAIMALVVGLLGWMLVMALLLLSGVSLFGGGGRRFLQMAFSLFVSEIPILDAAPALTPNVYLIIRAQRKEDREAAEKYAAAYATQIQEQQQEQRARAEEIQATYASELSAFDATQAANDAVSASATNDAAYEAAANDAYSASEEIPVPLPEAA